MPSMVEVEPHFMLLSGMSISGYSRLDRVGGTYKPARRIFQTVTRQTMVRPTPSKKKKQSVIRSLPSSALSWADIDIWFDISKKTTNLSGSFFQVRVPVITLFTVFVYCLICARENLLKGSLGRIFRSGVEWSTWRSRDKDAEQVNCWQQFNSSHNVIHANLKRQSPRRTL